MTQQCLPEVHTWTKEEIYENICNQYRWLRGAVVALYKCQTEQEQKTGCSLESNKMGFTKVDAGFMTSLVNGLKQGREFTPKQQAAARRALKKYSGQLTRMANKTM